MRILEEKEFVGVLFDDLKVELEELSNREDLR
jgi:hypothetical protein